MARNLIMGACVQAVGKVREVVHHHGFLVIVIASQETKKIEKQTTPKLM